LQSTVRILPHHRDRLLPNNRYIFSSPGCENTNECYLPYQVEIYSGEPVVWINVDSAAHTVTSGSPALHDGLFDSGMLMPDQKWEYVFTDSGEYDYHCMLHPWMTGKVIVN